MLNSWFRKFWTTLLLAVLLTGGLTASAAELVLVSPHWEGIEYEFGEAFKKHYKAETGQDIDLKWLDVGGTSDIIRYIESEFKNKPEGIGIDLMFGGGVDPYFKLKDEGLLTTYRLPEEILNEIAPDIAGSPLYDPEYTWYAPTMAGFGIIYNKPLIKKRGLPTPKTWADLARPEYFSWVGTADPGKSGSVHMCYEIILQSCGWERGWEIVTALGGNARSFSAAASQVPKDTATGDVACGLAIDFYAKMQAIEAGEDIIGFVYPAGLTVVNGDAIGILKGAPNLEAAQAFIRFVMSEPGQRLWMLRVGESDGPVKYELAKFSVMPKVYDLVEGRTSVDVDPFAWPAGFRYDPELGSLRWKMVSDLVRVLVIEPHDDLTRVWKAAVESGNADAALKTLAGMPLTEDEATELCRSGQWDDERFRNEKLVEWRAFAAGKYGAKGFGRNLPALIVLGIVIVAIVYAAVKRHIRRKG